MHEKNEDFNGKRPPPCGDKAPNLHEQALEGENDPPREEFLREIWVMCGFIGMRLGRNTTAW